MIKVGLTGGIATGKSTIAERWRELGAQVVDADQLAHATLEPGTATWTAVVATFGQEIVNADRTINRPKLGEIVFGDERKRAALNQIVHPAVRQMWSDRLARWDQAGNVEVAVAVIPLLYEVGVEKEFAAVVVAACSEPTQLARLTNKGLTEVQARARMRAQWPLTMKMDRADYVIWNDGTQQVLTDQTAIIWKSIKEKHHAPTQRQ